MNEKLDGSKPIKLSSTRAWRTYIGGKLLEGLLGEENPTDSHFPEEWIMSVVSARNKGREDIVDEGLSKVDIHDVQLTLKSLIENDPEGFLGGTHVKEFSVKTGVLVKIIDAAERLTVQVHPDRIKARELFNSEYGKTEAWHILGGREIEGEPPHVYLGFKPGVTKEKWKQLFEKQDIQGMLDCMHKYYVEPGNTFLIEAGTPHAIGAGCLLVEIQEPTDFTIRIEKTTPQGFTLDDFMCHQGIGFEKMFECFTYANYTREETLNKWKITPTQITETNGNKEFELIGYNNIPYFKMNLLEVNDEMKIEGNNVFYGLLVVSGIGSIISGEDEQSLTQGNQFFIPAKVSSVTLRNTGEESLKVMRLFGPQVI
ncbi:mannose-6-phosphate isomerase [Bacillus sp. HNG]|uniref:class I mannose-6-phosphate isomerase n=1 Tax=Bacillus sp. HNG TaxID=2293325 RepID=UPI000E2EE0F3|nr:class I mannose-6-phosphate isomerase [Bacillus sp. HNG]RFB12609.1 mannose-6-phosphate isomerase [Bacillus sp. HNG]